jgi:hypothetical protein
MKTNGILAVALVSLISCSPLSEPKRLMMGPDLSGQWMWTAQETCPSGPGSECSITFKVNKFAVDKTTSLQDDFVATLQSRGWTMTTCKNRTVLDKQVDGNDLRLEINTSKVEGQLDGSIQYLSDNPC